MSHLEVNKIVVQMWRNLSDAEKSVYKNKAKLIQENNTVSHKCPKCDEHFENQHLIIEHLMQSHINTPNNSVVDDQMSNQSRIWKCKDCGRMFCSEDKLQEHITIDHSQENMVEVSENPGDKKEIIWAKVSSFL